MNFYQFHIGDYIKQTVHLTPMEDICYRRLIDMYYETEQPIPTETDRVSRRLRLDTELVDLVLKEFFTLTENGWENARCNKEIDTYHVKADTARSNGKLGGRPKKTNPVSDKNPPESGSKANQEPVTKNHKPRTVKEHTADKSALFESFWTLWPATDRRTNKAKCAAAWAKNSLDAMATEILSHVSALKETEKWKSGFEPAPMTYLNGKQWEDGLPTVQRQAPRSGSPPPTSKQANRDSYAAQAHAAAQRLNGGNHESTGERDITGTCTVIA